MTTKPKREKRIDVRLNDVEYELIRHHSEKTGLAIAEILRDYIKSLPH